MGDSGNDKAPSGTHPDQNPPEKVEELDGSLEKRKQNVRRDILNSEARNSKQNQQRGSFHAEEMQRAGASEERDVSIVHHTNGFEATPALANLAQPAYHNQNHPRGIEDVMSPPRRPARKRRNRNQGATSTTGKPLLHEDHVRKLQKQARSSDTTVQGLDAGTTPQAASTTPRSKGNGTHQLDVSLCGHRNKAIVSTSDEGFPSIHSYPGVAEHGSNLGAPQRLENGIPPRVDIPSRFEPSSVPYVKVGFDCFQFSSLAEAKKFLGIDPSTRENPDL